MVICEFSGEQVDTTIQVEIAGAVMNVAPKYAHLGKVVESRESSSPRNTRHKPSHSKQKIVTKRKKEQKELEVVEDISSILHSFMAKRNLTIKHLAHNAHLKEGMLQKMLQGKIYFDIKTAQILEKAFDLELTQERENHEEKEDISEYLVDSENTSRETEETSSMKELLKDVLPELKK